MCEQIARAANWRRIDTCLGGNLIARRLLFLVAAIAANMFT
jgi:hypothetical protein